MFLILFLVRKPNFASRPESGLVNHLFAASITYLCYPISVCEVADKELTKSRLITFFCQAANADTSPILRPLIIWPVVHTGTVDLYLPTACSTSDISSFWFYTNWSKAFSFQKETIVINSQTKLRFLFKMGITAYIVLSVSGRPISIVFVFWYSWFYCQQAFMYGSSICWSLAFFSFLPLSVGLKALQFASFGEGF